MAQFQVQQAPSQGTGSERELFSILYRHYAIANEDLIIRRRQFNKTDIAFRSYIDKANWPYRSLVVDNRSFTALIEKMSRLLANKPSGRMIPRESGDALGAQINNDLLSFQWDDNERVDNLSMLAKWGLMDLNTRKYGASFGLCKWHYEARGVNGKKKVFFDGPNFKPLNNRDCLPNPSYSSIKNWFQHRDYLTLQELSEVNDAARSKPIYKNLDLLKVALSKDSPSGGDRRDTNYVIYNKSLKGLRDFLGSDPAFKTIEVVTEYRPDRWITFSPKHGIVLRDIPNPYNHGQIPIVMLRYYIVDDDLYGLSELEPVEKVQNAINALICQYLDAINMALYSPLMVNSTGGRVQMHTLEFGPGKKWLMSEPGKDVVPYASSVAGIREFTETYRFLVSSMQETLGETSAGISNLVPGQGAKTATEVKDLAGSRSIRDNMNQNFLGDALKKQMMFWHTMNQQFLFANPQERQKIMRIAGPDSIEFFQKMGLDKMVVPQETQDLMSQTDTSGVNMDLNLFKKPLHPVKQGKNIVPKFSMETGSKVGTLIVEPDDLAGDYDYIPDVQSMQIPDEKADLAARQQFLSTILNPEVQNMVKEQGFTMDVKELLEDILEDEKLTDADKYFKKIEPTQPGVGEQPTDGQQAQKQEQAKQKVSESINYKDAPPDIQRQIEEQAGMNPSEQHQVLPVNPNPNGTNQAGAGGVPPGEPGMGNGGVAGMAGGNPPVPGL